MFDPRPHLALLFRTNWNLRRADLKGHADMPGTWGVFAGTSHNVEATAAQTLIEQGTAFDENDPANAEAIGQFRMQMHFNELAFKEHLAAKAAAKADMQRRIVVAAMILCAKP